MSRIVIVVVSVLWLVSTARGDEPAQTIVDGRVSDIIGRPIANARIHVVPRDGVHAPIEATTDSDGRYRVELQTAGEHGVVIASDRTRTFRTVIVEAGVVNKLDLEIELDTTGGEVIKIVDPKRPPPAVKAKPTKDPRLSLPYSDEAVARDVWVRAWLLLDVDERGRVTRLKLLKAPGFDLDKICIEAGLALTFEPARDAEGRPVKTYLLWTMEWPSWGWLVHGEGVTVRRPKDRNDRSPAANRDTSGDDAMAVETRIGVWSNPQASGTVFDASLDRVPCAGSGPLNLDLKNRAYRDCSKPDLGKAVSLPWITKETMADALAELEPRTTRVKPAARWPGYVSLGVTGALVIATAAAYLQFGKYQDRLDETRAQSTLDRAAWEETDRAHRRWGKITLGLTAATLAAGGVTVLVWKRRGDASSLRVAPSEHGGAAAWYTRSW